MSDVWCDECNSVKLSPNHRCPPSWLCRLSNDDVDWSELALFGKKFFGRNADKAAEKFTEGYLATDPPGDPDFALTVQVMPWPAMNKVITVSVEAAIVYSFTSEIVSSEDYMNEEES